MPPQVSIPNYWMISNRNKLASGLGPDRAAGLSFWIADATPLTAFKNWSEVSRDRFQKALVAAADKFPLILEPEKHEDQKHVTLFVHGYDNDWKSAAERYESICGSLFAGKNSVGLCILFSWPSDGMKLGYLPDRMDARNSAPDFAEILSAFYDWLINKQVEGAEDPKKSCRAKTSVIAHSMGNYLLQNAMQVVWTRKNQPLLTSLINQLLMVAADVDNDLFKSGESTDKSDGDAIANLTYRVTALYSGRDPVLGLSAGLKHFGKRRLGRSGLDRTYPIPDNVWDIDCSSLFKKDEGNIHSAYFATPTIIELMRQVLRGVDRTVLVSEGIAPARVAA